MTFLDELERELSRIASAPPVRRRRWRPFALLALLPLCVATVAVAATGGILSGKPVKRVPGARANPKSGFGVLVGTGKLLGLRVADPAGGAPWAMRMVRTSRGFGCVQVGRFVDGKLGVLGRDGAFNNDGLFHERGVDSAGPTNCQQSDGAGHVFVAVGWMGMPDSADPASCVARTCPAGSLRTMFFGLLGPEATAVTYRDRSGRIIRQPVSRPEGAYLVVLPIDPKRTNFYYSPGVSPGSGLRTVEYADGSRCTIGNPARIGGARSCPLKGYVAPKFSSVSAAQLATPVRVHVGTAPVHPGQTGNRGTAERVIKLVFRARVAADARSFYTYFVTPEHPRKTCLYTGGGAVARDLAAGTVVTQELYVPYHCHGTLNVSIGFTQQRTPSSMPFATPPVADGRVGVATVRVPG